MDRERELVYTTVAPPVFARISDYDNNPSDSVISATETSTTSVMKNEPQDPPLQRRRTLSVEKEEYEDEEVKRAAEIAMTISSSNLSAEEAMLIHGQDSRQKQFLEGAKKKSQAGWIHNVNSMFAGNVNAMEQTQWLTSLLPQEQKTTKTSNLSPSASRQDVEVTKKISKEDEHKKSPTSFHTISKQKKVVKSQVKTQIKSLQETLKASQHSAKKKIKDSIKQFPSISTHNVENRGKNAPLTQSYGSADESNLSEGTSIASKDINPIGSIKNDISPDICLEEVNPVNSASPVGGKNEQINVCRARSPNGEAIPKLKSSTPSQSSVKHKITRNKSPRRKMKRTNPRSIPASMSDYEPHTDSSEDNTTTTTGMKKFLTLPTLLSTGSNSGLSESEPVTLETVVWKRKSGLSKLYTPHAWQRRKLAIQGSKLFYFSIHNDVQEEKLDHDFNGSDIHDELYNNTEQDKYYDNKKLNFLEQAAAGFEKATENLKQLATAVPLPSHYHSADPSDPRGMMDILKENASISAASVSSGPTPFAISIKSSFEHRWKICFDTHKEQFEWLMLLSEIIVKKSVQHHCTESDKENRDVSSFHSKKKWNMMDEKDLHEMLGVKKIKTDVEKPLSCSRRETVGSNRNVPSQSLLSLCGIQLVGFLMFLNLALGFTHGAGSYELIYIQLIVNAYIWYSLSRAVPSSENSLQPTTEESPSMVEIPNKEVENETRSDFVPIAGSTCLKIKHICDSRSSNSGRTLNAWREVSGTTLNVRAFGYLSHKVKRSSPGELYECAGVDVYTSNKRIPRIGKRINLSTWLSNTSGEKETRWHCPDIFIVTLAVPIEAPKLTKTETDGPGVNVVVYFKMKDATRKILEQIAIGDSSNQDLPGSTEKDQINGVKLFNEWCRRAPTDPKFFGRFKLVPDIINLKEVGLPSYIAKYNSKPVLIKRSGITGFISSHSDKNVMEFDISLHPFPYLAKQAFSYLNLNYFSKLVATLGFVIEGRCNNELPEVVIGATQLCNLDSKIAVSAKDLFSGRSVSSSQ